MDMPTEPTVLPESRINSTILAAYEAGKSAERFFDHGATKRLGAGEPSQGQGPRPVADAGDWHH